MKLRELKIWGIVTVLGILIGLIASLTEIQTLFLSDLKEGYCSTWYLNRKFCCWESSYDSCTDWTQHNNFFIYLFLSLVMVSLAFLFVQFYASFAAGSGLPEIKAISNGYNGLAGFLSPVTGLIKAISVSLVVSSGLSVGKESTFVHISSCLVSFFKLEPADHLSLLIVASATGISVVFGAPIAGVLFAIEEISSNFTLKTMWMSFYCCIVASATMQSIDPFRTGKIVMYQTTYDRDWHVFEVFFFIILGCLGGLYGVAMVKVNIWLAKLRKNHPFWTGNNVSWKDWFTWVVPAFQNLMKKINSWANYRRMTRDSSSMEELDPEMPQNTQEFQEEINWWDIPKHVLYRFYQELLIVCLLTVSISYSHPYLRQDMTYFLSGLLQECPDDRLLTNPITVNPNTTFYLFSKRDIEIPVDSGDSAAGGRGHGVVGEQIDYYHLCDQSVSSLPPILIVTALLRMLLTVFTFGLRIPAGVYLPSMVIGACFGRAVGMIVSAFTPASIIITPGTYALVGAASTLGGITKLTVSVAVIMFEITGGGALSYIVPIMIALMSAKFVADALDRGNWGSISEAYIKFHGYPFLNNKKTFRFLRAKEVDFDSPSVTSEANTNAEMVDKKTLYESVIALDVMMPISEVTVIPVYESVFGEYRKPFPHTVNTIEKILDDSPFEFYPIVETTENMLLVGAIYRKKLKEVIKKSTKKYLIKRNAPCFFMSQDDVEAYYQDENHISNVSSPTNLLNIEEAPVTSITISTEGQFRLFINFSPWIDRSCFTVLPNYPMDLIVEMFKKMMLDFVLVTNEGVMALESSGHGKPLALGALLGILTKMDVLRAIEKLENEDSGEINPILQTSNEDFGEIETTKIPSVPPSPSKPKTWIPVFSASSATSQQSQTSSRSDNEGSSSHQPSTRRPKIVSRISTKPTPEEEYFVDSSGNPIKQ